MIVCIIHGCEREHCPTGCLAPRTERAEGEPVKRPLIQARKPSLSNEIPICSHLVCPKFVDDKCTEWNNDPPSKFADLCLPEIRDNSLALDAHKDASEPAFDEIVKLCGFAKTWEYPGQVIRDVQDVVKERDEIREKLRLSELRITAFKERMQHLRSRVQFAEAEIIRLIDEE